MRRLVKSQTNRLISGVCGGLGEYFQVDATLIRLLWALFCLMGGSGVVAYIVAAIIMPNE